LTEERQTDATAGTNGTTGEPVVASGAQTVEEVEAFWRNRSSGKDRAHNAETAALHAQIEALKAQPAPAPVGESPEAARIRELESNLQQERARAAAAELRSQYPQAASILGDSIANLPPEKVAAIEAWADNGQVGVPPRIEPNAAPRPAGAGMPGGGAKPLNEKSKDELLADLRRLALAAQEAMREGSF
jgi:hypothetical protein